MSKQEVVLNTLLIFSILFTFLASIFLNEIKGLRSYIYRNDLQLFERLNIHARGGICGLAIITGWILVFIFMIELYILNYYGTSYLKKYSKVFMVIVFTYAFFQFIMNSVFDYRILRPEMWDYYGGLGLFEYMIPVYILQFFFFHVLTK